MAPDPQAYAVAQAKKMRMAAKRQRDAGLQVPVPTNMEAEDWWIFMQGRTFWTYLSSLAIYAAGYQYAHTLGTGPTALTRATMDQVAIQVVRYGSWNKGAKQIVFNPVFADLRQQTFDRVVSTQPVLFTGLNWYGDWQLHLEIRRNDVPRSSTEALTAFDPTSMDVIVERLWASTDGGRTWHGPNGPFTIKRGQSTGINLNVGLWCGGGNSGLTSIGLTKAADQTLMVNFKMYSYGWFGAGTGCNQQSKNIAIRPAVISYPMQVLQHTPTPAVNRDVFQTWGGFETVIMRGTTLATYYYNSLTPNEQQTNFDAAAKAYFKRDIGVYTNLFLQGFSPGSPAVILAALMELAGNPWRWDNTQSVTPDSLLPPAAIRNRPLTMVNRQSRVAMALNLALQIMGNDPSLFGSIEARDQVLRMFELVIGYHISWRVTRPQIGERDFRKWQLVLAPDAQATAADWLCDDAVVARAVTLMLTMFPTSGGSAYDDTSWPPVVQTGIANLPTTTAQGTQWPSTNIWFTATATDVDWNSGMGDPVTLSSTPDERQSMLVPMDRMTFAFAAPTSSENTGPVTWLNNPLPYTWLPGAKKWIMQPYTQVRYNVNANIMDDENRDLPGLPPAPNDDRPGYTNDEATFGTGGDYFIMQQESIMASVMAALLETRAPIPPCPPWVQPLSPIPRRLRDTGQMEQYRIEREWFQIATYTGVTPDSGWVRDYLGSLNFQDWHREDHTSGESGSGVDLNEAARAIQSMWRRSSAQRQFRSQGNALSASSQAASSSSQARDEL